MYLHRCHQVVIFILTFDIAAGSLRPKTRIGHSWARQFDIETEDQELTVAGLHYKRLLQVSSADFTTMVTLITNKSSPSGVELRAAAAANPQTFQELDVTLGTGRDLCTEVDKPGGPAAVPGADCDFHEWENYRKDFLEEVKKINFDVPTLQRHPTDVEPSFDKYLRKLLEKFEKLKLANDNPNYVKNVSADGPLELFEFFEQLCISCTGDPILQCDEKTQKCTCWDFYINEKAQSQGSEGDDCRIGVGNRCHHTQGAKCVKNAFCDQEYLCKCKTRKTCSTGDAAKFYFPLKVWVTFGLILALAMLF